MDKVGLQTIIFGRRIDDLAGVLRLIQASGYRGVEFSQPPRLIRETVNGSPATHPVKAQRLLQLLDDHGLALLGLAGGSVRERMDFCLEGASSERPLYLYVETCDLNTLLAAATSGFRLALHPHAFMPNHQPAKAMRLLHELSLDIDERAKGEAGGDPYRNLYWLPDTAHFFVLGHKFEDALASVDVSRIIAVHLKDWDAAYGRSYHRYARGFTELGKGNVRPERALDQLRAHGFAGWVVVEQDYTKNSAKQSIYQNAKWMQDHGAPIQPSSPVEYSRLPQPPPVIPKIDDWPFDQLRRGFLQIIGQDLSAAYRLIASTLKDALQCRLVTVWACSQGRDHMNLLAADPALDLPERVAKDEMFGSSIDLLEISRRGIGREGHNRVDSQGDALMSQAATLGATTVLGLPVPNRYNQHHVRLFIAVFIDDAWRGLSLSEDALERAFEITARELAGCLDSTLDDHCEYAAGRVNTYAGRHQSSASFLKEFIEQVRSDLQCQGVTIFQRNPAETRLEQPVSTGMSWRVPRAQRFYELDEDTFVSEVWRSKEPLLIDSADTTTNLRCKSTETSGVDADRSDLLGVPLLTSSGTVLGVVRCRNKHINDALTNARRVSGDTIAANFEADRTFTDDDAAIVDSACNAAVPHLRLLRDDLLRANAARRLTHELKAPVAVLRHAVDALDAGLAKIQSTYADTMRSIYVSDIFRLTDLVARLIGNVDIYGGKYRRLELSTAPTSLRDDVIIPSVRHAGALLSDRQFDPHNVVCRYFEGVPRLHVDQTLFLQVFFNLLANSIKFAYDDPQQFRIEIAGRREGKAFKLFFRDWGPGITEGQQELIFGEEFRGPEFMNKIVTGQGLGLWIVRRIVRAHGGDVTVTICQQPTEFTITLPQRLESGPPIPGPISEAT